MDMLTSEQLEDIKCFAFVPGGMNRINATEIGTLGADAPATWVRKAGPFRLFEYWGPSMIVYLNGSQKKFTLSSGFEYTFELSPICLLALVSEKKL